MHSKEQTQQQKAALQHLQVQTLDQRDSEAPGKLTTLSWTWCTPKKKKTRITWAERDADQKIESQRRAGIQTDAADLGQKKHVAANSKKGHAFSIQATLKTKE